jgi:two-component system chemotaxis sensor kinase CheA
MSDADALLLTTLPGFTTAPRVSHVSGRGVGLDVVRTEVERLGGLLEMQSEAGRGLTMHLGVPLRLALVRTMLVRCAGELYAVPVDMVERMVDLRAPGATEDLVLLHLAERLGAPAAPAPGSDPRALVLATAGQPTGLVVDEVIGRRDLVVKPLRAPLSQLREYSGAALLEDGSIALVLDPFHLA